MSLSLLGQAQEASTWEALLSKHVDGDGNVDYRALQKNPAGLTAYLDFLATHPPSQDSQQADSLAYFINLYNAATLQLIVSNYPLKSIRDIDSPWSKPVVRVGNKKFSLEEVEHDILRGMNEPRIHFAINCASRSCPPLYRKPFKPELLEKQLEAVTSAFINAPSLNRINPNQLVLSRIFDWYKEDFGGDSGVRKFIQRYTAIPIAKDATVEYLEYDWKLNGQH